MEGVLVPPGETGTEKVRVRGLEDRALAAMHKGLLAETAAGILTRARLWQGGPKKATPAVHRVWRRGLLLP